MSYTRDSRAQETSVRTSSHIIHLYDVLLDGDFRPKHPELNYPMVIATTKTKRIIALYADMVITPDADVPNELYLINGSHKPSMVLKLESALETRTIEVRNPCTN